MSITYTTARCKKICDYALKYGKMKAHELYGVSRPSIDRWLNDMTEARRRLRITRVASKAIQTKALRKRLN